MQKTVAKDLAKEITEPVTSALLPITDGVQKAVELTKYPSIQAAETDQDIDTSMVILGTVAENYLRQFASKEEVDKTFGLYDKHGEFFIGDSPVKIEGDDIIVKDKEYQGTPGLWELLIMKKRDKSIYNREDFRNYAEILRHNNAMKHNHDPRSNKPKSSKSQKYKEIIRPIWDMVYSGVRPSIGQGVGTTVIPSNPDALIDRLDLLMASNVAGNTSIRNELISICDELLRQNVIAKDLYKKLMITL